MMDNWGRSFFVTFFNRSNLVILNNVPGVYLLRNAACFKMDTWGLCHLFQPKQFGFLIMFMLLYLLRGNAVLL